MAGVRIQSAITTADIEPEPDLAIVRGAIRDVLGRHPGPADLALVVEVADSTLAVGRDLKGRIDSRSSIPVYWIVNLADRRVAVATTPTDPDATPGCRERRDPEAGAAIALLIEGRAVARIEAREFLP